MRKALFLVALAAMFVGVPAALWFFLSADDRAGHQSDIEARDFALGTPGKSA
jgi:hypothetical protein